MAIFYFCSLILHVLIPNKEYRPHVPRYPVTIETSAGSKSKKYQGLLLSSTKAKIINTTPST
jgi:hypothetical protein